MGLRAVGEYEGQGVSFHERDRQGARPPRGNAAPTGSRGADLNAGLACASCTCRRVSLAFPSPSTHSTMQRSAMKHVQVPNTEGLVPEGGKKPTKNIAIQLHSLWGDGVPSPLTPTIYTGTGLPGCSTAVLKQLAGPPGRASKALAKLEHTADAGGARVWLEAWGRVPRAGGRPGVACLHAPLGMRGVRPGSMRGV